MAGPPGTAWAQRARVQQVPRHLCTSRLRPVPAGDPGPAHRAGPSPWGTAGGASQQSPRPGAHGSPAAALTHAVRREAGGPRSPRPSSHPGGGGARAPRAGAAAGPGGVAGSAEDAGDGAPAAGPGAATRPPPPGRRRPRLFLRALCTLAAAGSSAADLSLGRSSATRVAGARVRREWRREQAPRWPRWEGGLLGRPRARPRERRRAPGTARALTAVFQQRRGLQWQTGHAGGGAGHPGAPRGGGGPTPRPASAGARGTRREQVRELTGDPRARLRAGPRPGPPAR